MKRYWKENDSRKPIKQFAEELSDAYSTDRYRNGWNGCIKMLRSWSYSDKQIEAVIRSKWTRWAADASKNGYGYATSKDLCRFFLAQGYGMKEVDQLTLESGL